MSLIRYLRSPLDLPIALFLASAWIGVWASYDPAASWRKFAMIVAAIALYYMLVAFQRAPQLLETFVWLFVFGCCVLTLYFVTQHDYANHPGKFDFITLIGLTLNRNTPQLRLQVFDPNITAGALEIGLAMGAALFASQKAKVKSQKGISLSSGLLVSLSVSVIIAFGLVMTSSRGAWLALGIVGGIAVLAVVAKDVLRRYAVPIGLIAILVSVILAMRLGDGFVTTLESILGTIPAGDTAVSRMELLGQAWGLVQDYYFTGSGLGVFPMILSTYALLIDVPFLTHVHNLFLQIWLEQGLLGFVAFVWLVIEFYFWSWNRRSTLNWVAWGGIAAGTVMLLHGTVDVLLYSSRGLPLLLVPFGVAVACGYMTELGAPNTEGEKKARNLNPGTGNLRLGIVSLAVFGLLFSSFIVHPSSFQAVWYANLGSVEQTKAELGEYRWPDRLVGQVRSDCRVSAAGCQLNQAVQYFQRALVLDPGNVTANQRLASIAVAQASFGDAQAMLGQAYQRDPSNKVTNRLLGLVSKQ